MVKTFSSLGFGLLMFVASISAAHATTIEYQTTSLGGNNYRYTYTVTNDTLTTPLQLFDIEFDPTLYLESSLQIVTPGSFSSWSETLFPSIPALSQPAIYDVYATIGGIAPGATLSGFAIEFQWLGTGMPINQNFQVFDANTFDLLESGVTRAASVTPPSGVVDTPETLLSIMLGLMLMLTTRIRNIRH